VKQSEFHTRRIELLERAVSVLGMIQDAFGKFKIACGRCAHADIIALRA
jgi:hypothetical protein